MDAATLASDEPGSCEPRRDRRSTRRLPGACLATRAWCGSSNATAARCRSAGEPAASPGAQTRAPNPRRLLPLPRLRQRRFLHAHHVEQWARGGRTDLSNLIHLCAFTTAWCTREASAVKGTEAERGQLPPAGQPPSAASADAVPRGDGRELTRANRRARAAPRSRDLRAAREPETDAARLGDRRARASRPGDCANRGASGPAPRTPRGALSPRCPPRCAARRSAGRPPAAVALGLDRRPKRTPRHARRQRQPDYSHRSVAPAPHPAAPRRSLGMLAAQGGAEAPRPRPSSCHQRTTAGAQPSSFSSPS